jgi:hypothetical protein
MSLPPSALVPLVAVLLFAAASPVRGQACTNPAIAPSTPTTDFKLDDNGTAHHQPTDLVWMRCAVGQTWTGTSCSGTARNITQWQQALQVAVDVNSGADDADNDGAPGFAGAQDWRLPSIRELASIHEACRTTPAHNTVVFPNAPGASNHWSSTTIDGSPSVAWYHDSQRGVSSFALKSDSLPRVARLVRGGGLGGHRYLGRLFADDFE